MIVMPPLLQADLDSGNHSLALLITITRTDGVIERTTTSDQDETFPDPVAPFTAHTYVASKGVGLSDLENNASLAVNNADVTRFLDAGTKDAIRAGVYDFAAVNVRVFNRLAPAHGSFWRFDGWLGEISVDGRLSFKSELRSTSQALSRTIGFNCTALCPYRLGDDNCRVDLGPFTVGGTLTGVSPDYSVMFDDARTEPGPAAGQVIESITNAKPGRVTLLTPVALPNGAAIMMFGPGQPALLNTVTVIRNQSGDGMSFDLGIDTSDTAVYPPYTGGWHIASLVADAGYFGYGVFTAATGAAAGFSMGVKAYRPGQIVLQAPMPFPMAIGDEYNLVAGCDKTIKTCRDKFDNVAPSGGGGFGGTPYLGGQDKLVQVGRAS